LTVNVQAYRTINDARELLGRMAVFRDVGTLGEGQLSKGALISPQNAALNGVGDPLD
jgi:hypothetical protein